jgi:3'-5' exoribonuclease
MRRPRAPDILWVMARLPRVRHLAAGSSGDAFFLCVRKDQRPVPRGLMLVLQLQDASGQITAKVFSPESERCTDQFDAGEFVHVEGRVESYNERLEMVLRAIRRVDPDADRQRGFREEDCIAASPRPAGEMWSELSDRIGSVRDEGLRILLTRIARDHEPALRLWPAALTVHHAYRGGLLEHILQVARAGDALAAIYEADRDLVFAGAMLHDIGKIRELDHDVATSYTREGNLLGHIALGLMMVREAAQGITALTDQRRTEVEHLVASHHGTREHGSPVEPMSVEAFILAAADRLDATVFQVRRHVAEDVGEGDFTGYLPRMGRVLLKR